MSNLPTVCRTYHVHLTRGQRWPGRGLAAASGQDSWNDFLGK